MKQKTPLPDDPCTNVNSLTQQNVDKVLKLEHATKSRATVADRIADVINCFCGSIRFAVIHLLWYGIWIGVNISFPQSLRFDPFPFSFLTLVISLEAIFLSAFILISQNRQNKLSERRSHLDLQINMLSEQENSKMLDLLEKAVKPEKLAEQIRAFHCANGEGEQRACLPLIDQSL